MPLIMYHGFSISNANPEVVNNSLCGTILDSVLLNHGTLANWDPIEL